jgi:hypothetical protein
MTMTVDSSANSTQDKKNPGDHWNRMLANAEVLIEYAAETGIKLKTELVTTVLNARKAGTLSTEDTVKAVEAMTEIAVALQPVTVGAIKAFKEEHRVKRRMYVYGAVAVIVGIIVAFGSVSTYMTTGLANILEKDINEANRLAVVLNNQYQATISGLVQPQVQPQPQSQPQSQNETENQPQGQQPQPQAQAAAPAKVIPSDAVRDFQLYTRTISVRPETLRVG